MNIKIRLHRGWAIALACFLAHMVVTGSSQYSFGHFVAPLESEFGWSRTQIGFSLSLIAFGFFISPFIGHLIDKHGARIIMSASLAIFGLSYLMRPFMTDTWHWYALGIIQAFTMVGASMLPTGKLIGLWFPQNRGKVLSVTVMGANMGGIAMQPFLAFLVIYFGWKIGYAGAGILALMVALYCFWIVRVPGPQFLSEQVEYNSGLTPVNYTLSQAVRTRLFYAIALASMCGSFTYSAILPQLSTHLDINGIPETTIAFAVTVFATCGMFGKLVFGIFSDRYGPRLSLIIDLLGQSVFAFLLVYAGPQIPVWFVVPLMGFFLGAFGALHQLIVMQSFGINHYGSIMGVIGISNSIPAFVGPILAGRSYDLTGDYALAFFVTAGIFFIGALSLIIGGKPIKNDTDMSQVV